MMAKIKKRIRKFLGMISVQDLKSGVYSLNREISNIKDVLKNEKEEPKRKKIEHHGV